MLVKNIELALKDFGSNKLRTFLSVLGIVIGVASVITITTLGRSATASVAAEVSKAGLNTIAVMPGRDSDREVRRSFTVELAQQLVEEVEGVDTALPINSGRYQLKRGKETTYGTAIAVEAGFQEVFSYEVEEGRFLSEQDNEKRSMVIVLGAQVAAELFPEGNALNQHVRLAREDAARSFKVIGVMKSKTGTMGLDFDASVYVPMNTYTKRINPIESVDRYFVSAADGVDVLEVSDRVSDFFLEVTRNEDSFRVMSPATMAKMATSITDTLSLFLTGVAAISLIVGGIGIMNIMLVSVTERTKEIGIRKALGASPRVIRGQFLTEAVALTMSGGLIGMVMGIGISFLATILLKWSFVPQFSAFLMAVGVSSTVGIFFGLYPAGRASRLDPVQALNFE
jgi:putative ABC transport system permease protein